MIAATANDIQPGVQVYELATSSIRHVSEMHVGPLHVMLDDDDGEPIFEFRDVAFL